MYQEEIAFMSADCLSVGKKPSRGLWHGWQAFPLMVHRKCCVHVRVSATTGNVQILKLHQRNFRNKRHSMFKKTCNQASIFDGFAPLIRLSNIKLFQAVRAKIEMTARDYLQIIPWHQWQKLYKLTFLVILDAFSGLTRLRCSMLNTRIFCFYILGTNGVVKLGRFCFFTCTILSAQRKLNAWNSDSFWTYKVHWPFDVCP